MNDQTVSSSTPVLASERYQSIDVLRGFALLGILIMNIQSFSMPGSAYLNPNSYGDLSGLNGWVWGVGDLFANTKFMTLFTLLFGAGIIIFTERAEQKTGGAFWLYYRRIFILLLIGVVHAYCFWNGDILVWYSFTAIVIYPFRKLAPGWQFTLTNMWVKRFRFGPMEWLWRRLTYGIIQPITRG